MHPPPILFLKSRSTSQHPSLFRKPHNNLPFLIPKQLNFSITDPILFHTKNTFLVLPKRNSLFLIIRQQTDPLYIHQLTRLYYFVFSEIQFLHFLLPLSLILFVALFVLLHCLFLLCFFSLNSTILYVVFPIAL